MNTTDIHSHMFNLKYLPVAGIIRRYSNNKVSLRMARGVERFLLNKTKSSFESEKGLKAVFKNMLNKLLGMFNAKDAEKIQTLLLNPAFKLLELNQHQIISNLSKQLNLDDLKDPLIADALLEFQEMLSLSADKKIKFGDVAIGKNSADALNSGNLLMDKLLKEVFEKMDEAMGGLEKAGNMARWFAFMLNSEEEIFKRIQGSDSQGVSRFVHQMMDVDYFFTEEDGTTHKSYFDFVTQQIPNMEKLDKKYPGKLHALVAFNPSRENSLEVVKLAMSKGFKGVKFYPPLGYRAHGDPNPIFQQRIAELFRYCSRPENDIPIFAHCNNQGFEAYPKGDFHYPAPRYPSGYNSSPVYWYHALRDFPDLRLCLAHGGGTEGWFCHVRNTDHIKAYEIFPENIKDDSSIQTNWNNSYAAMVFKLCVERPNVYCDAAYLDDMVLPDGSFDETAKANFKKRLLRLFMSEPKFASRIIYGSDWHMLFQEGKNQVYYSTYLRFYSEPEFMPYKNDFFEANAKRYLKF